MKNKLYWGFAILMILLIGVSVVLLTRTTDTEPITIYKVPPDEQVKRVVLKKPPPGETYGTGHWHGDTWHRSVPPAPTEVDVDGEVMTYEELARKVLGGSLGKIAKYPYMLRVIEEYPYSEAAFAARFRMVRYDYETFEYRLLEPSALIPRYEEILQYHPDSPRLLQTLANLIQVNFPERAAESIAYGKEALKYSSIYSWDTTYGYPHESIHYDLGMAYQHVGDYKSALVHLKASLGSLQKTDRVYDYDMKYSILTGHIEAIESGSPIYGPLPSSEVSAFSEVLGFDDASDVDDAGEVDVNDSVVDIPPFPDDELEGSDFVSPPAFVDSSGEAFVRQQRERERREFDAFVRWLEDIEQAASPSDLEDFLMREMAKQLQGESTVFSADRMVRARELLQRHGESEGMRRLAERDAALAREMERASPKNGVSSRSVPNKS